MSTTRSTRKPSTSSKPSKAPKVGTIGQAACKAQYNAAGKGKPANLHQLACAVAQLGNQGMQYKSAAAMYAAACPNGYAATLGSQARQAWRALGQGVGRGRTYTPTPASWLAVYNTHAPNRQVHAK